MTPEQGKSRSLGAVRRGLTCLALLGVWLGCSQGEAVEGSAARTADEGWVVVGRPRELREEAAREVLPSGKAPRVSRLQEAPARAPSVRAWQEAPSEERALLLARAYFPELAGGAEAGEQRVPVPPETALRVRLPATENGGVEVASRGYVFRATPRASSGGASSKPSAGATFYGARHFWTVPGGQGLEQRGLWLTQRAEEFVVMEAGGTPYRATYEVEVPEGIQVVRDAGEYLEFLDGADVPVVRFHYAVARDAAGRGRQGLVRLGGVRSAGRGGPGNLPRLALAGRTLTVELEVGLEGLEGPVVVDPGWSSTGSLAMARYRQTSTLLHNGKVLVAAGDSEGGWGVQMASTELYDPATGTWSSAGTLAYAREFHTATLLPNGKVLLAGGLTTGRSAIASAELYDPETGTWSLTGSMGTARCGHTATLLNTGKVLVTGGGDGNGVPFTNAELYDPATGTWSATGSMVRAVGGHTATLLNTGKVLVAGGYGLTSAAQLYDPAVGTWSATGPLAAARYYHTATLLPNGKVLVTGGSNGSSLPNTLASSELYDPATGTWSGAASLTRPHQFHTATLLPNGKVLVGCGYSYSSSSGGGGAVLVQPEVYDPATGAWSATSPMAELRYEYSTTLLPDGSVLVAGGYSGPTRTAEIYSPAAGTWSTTGPLTAARSSHTTTLLPSGKVLVVGGQGASGFLTSVELYDPAAGTWSTTGALATARARHTATLLSSGRVLVTGGEGTSGPLTQAELYDPTAGTWSTTGALTTARARHTATALPGGLVLVAGGHGASGPLTSAELYAPAAGTWLSTGSLATARSGHTATLLNTGKVLLVGGQSASAPLASAELYDPATGTFSGTGTPSTARADHTATLLPTGKVLLTGGSGSSGAVASAELYDPATGTFIATGSLATARARHLALLLPTGRVLVASGLGSAGRLSSMEVYDPPSGTFSAGGALGAARADATVTPLPSGRVLAVGGSAATGALASAEVYEDSGASEAWRPVVTPPASLQSGWTLTVNGSGLRGISEASGGNTLNSAANFPLLSLLALEGGKRTPVAVQGFSSTSVTLRVPSVLDGYYLMSVTTNAIPGGAVVFVDGPPAAPALTAPAALVRTSRPTLAGTAEAGSTVTVSLDGATFGTATANAVGAWSFTPNSSLGDGPYTATATATDAAGNTSVPSAPRAFTVDTTAPSAPVISSPAAFVSNVTPAISGTAEPGSSVTVTLDGTTGVGTVTANGAGAWSLVPASPLTQGAHTATATATDPAGNTSLPSAAHTFTVDTVAPPTPAISAPSGLIRTTTPTLSGTAEAGSTVTVRVDTGSARTVTANASGDWSLTVASALTQGAHTATATATDAAGNTSSASAQRGFTVDTVAPAAPVLTAPFSLVNTTTPVISGTAEAGSTVTVTVDGTGVGTVTANASSGAWSLTVASPLAEGAHAATATATDAAGNTSTTSAQRGFTVDTVAPAAPVLTAPAAVVSNPRPAISGTAEPSSSVTVRLDGSTAGTVTANASGNWSFTPASPLSQGAHTATATATDAAGNTSPLSAARSFTVDAVDTVPPAAPVLTAPAAIVYTSLPTIAGTAEAGSTVAVRLDGSAVGTVTANASGSWSFTPASPLAQGTHTVTATATDAAGNTSAPSATRSFTVDLVDRVAPEAPVLTAPAAVVALAMPVISGTAEAGSTVTVWLNGQLVGRAIANDSGAWSFTPPAPLPDAPYTATATATDAAGNTSAASAPRSFTVDTTAPNPPRVLTPAAGATVSPDGLRFAGAAEAGSTVTVLVDGLEVGTTAADESSAWLVDSLQPLAPGPHTVTATARDGVGNVSQASAPISFTVEEEARGCGCTSSPTGGAAYVLGLLALWAWGRRGRR